MITKTSITLSKLRSLAALCVAALAVSLLNGCASFYVDTALKDLKPEQVVKVQDPKPVQLLFEFQTKGAPNARATEHLKQQVTELATASRIFSQVSATPVNGGAILDIKINNVPLTDDAFGKGFVTGLTFGLAGNTVTDGYVCTVNYLPGNGAPRLSRTVRHAIHTTVGAQDGPANAQKAESIEEAVRTMARQIVSNALNDLATDAAFR